MVGKNCIVPKCKMNSIKNKVGFFKIPTASHSKKAQKKISLKRRQCLLDRHAWIRAMKLEPDKILKSDYVCELHFVTGIYLIGSRY